MGKASKSITFHSGATKKVKSEVKLAALQKVKKSNNAIKKQKMADQQKKNDYEELKALLKLDNQS